ncbi:MAG: amidohydrolase family protein [bacterium]|nr:amidohydrolase family protein [bacterium]
MKKERTMTRKLSLLFLPLVVAALIGIFAPTSVTLAEEKIPPQILIKNVRIFDGVNEKLMSGSVLIEGNLIKKIGKSVKADPRATVIDGGGRVMTPGFIDSHTHMSLIAPFDQLENEYSAIYVGAAAGQMAEDMLMRGFTSVRDAGGASIGVQRAIDDGWFKGPRVFSSGAFITQTSGHLDMRDRTNPHRHVGGAHSHAEQIGHYVAVDGEAEMLAATRQNFRAGATQLKLASNGGISATYSPLDIDQFTDNELAAASFVAESFGSYFMVHAYYDNAVSRSIDFGAKSIEHGHLMTEDVITKMAKHGVYLVVEALMSTSEPPPSFTVDQREKFELAKSGFGPMIELAKKYELKIAFGSDVFLSKEAYAGQAQEWVARSKLFSPVENLRHATSIGGEILALSGPRNRYREGPLGVIKEGAYADLLIIDGDPLKDITILANPEKSLRLIMKDGVIYRNTLPQGDISRIAFGSCTRQMQDAPLLNTVVAAKPDLFLMIGDVVYPDINDEATGLLDPWPSDDTLARIKQVYAQMAAKPEYQNLQKNIPMMAVWDDHDYGINDGSADFPLKDESQQLFLDFFDEPANSERRKTPGIYDAKTFGPKGKRVQIILLDTRYFRTPPLPDTRSAEEKNALNIAGRYAPSEEPTATILGETQWRWLEEQFRESAELRLLVSSYPVIPYELGRDSWGNFPLERQRLFDLIGETKAHGVVILSGDVHFAEISETGEGPYPLVDFTSSALAAPSTGNENFTNSLRISKTYAEVNFGLVEIDWNAQPAPQITLKAVGLDGSEAFEHTMSLDTLQ